MAVFEILNDYDKNYTEFWHYFQFNDICELIPLKLKGRITSNLESYKVNFSRVVWLFYKKKRYHLVTKLLKIMLNSDNFLTFTVTALGWTQLGERPTCCFKKHMKQKKVWKTIHIFNEQNIRLMSILCLK